VSIPLHLAVHLSGVAVAAGLALLVLLPPIGSRRHESPLTALPAPARWSVTLGAALLAASHLVVGSLVADPDTWPLLLRAGGYAALAVGAAGGLAGSPTFAGPHRHAAVGGPALLAFVALPSVLPLAAGLAGAAACVATARGVLGRGRQIVPLVAGVGLWAGGDLVVGARPAVGAGLSLAGSLAAGSWVLRRAARRSLAGRFTGVSLVTLLALVVGLGAASGLVLASDVQAEQRDRLTAVAAAQAADLVDRTGAALDATASALAGATLVDPLVAGDAALAQERIVPILRLPDVEVAVLTDAAGALVAARVRAGAETADLALAAGNLVAGADVTERALAGQLARGVIDLGDGSLLVVGAAPVAPRGADGQPQLGRQAGALVLGRDLTSTPVIERVASDTATDASIVVAGEVVASTLPAADAEAVAAGLGGGTAVVGGTERVTAGAALGERAQLVLALPPDAATDAAGTATRSAFLLAVVGLGIAGTLITVLARRTAEPVARLTSAAERVAAGDLDTRVAVDREDEVGRLAAAFDGMTTSLADRDRDLRTSLAVQEALRDRLEAVTASMGEGLLATDAHGIVRTANPAAAEILEVRGIDDLVGRPLREVLRGRAEGGGDLLEALGSGDSLTAARGELAGSGRVVEATGAPLTGTTDEATAGAAGAVGAAGAAGAAGRVYVVRDISARVLADRVRTEVIANLSHELNTPLTPIKAFLEIVAARGGVDERFTPMLDLAREGRARLERTISALVDLAELEAGRTPVAITALPVGTIVGDLLARWQEREPQRTMTRRVRRGTPSALGDPALVGRVLDALVDNALKFSTGPVRITAEGEGGEVRVRVRDDGPGIPPARRAEVFELFVQADGSSTRAVGGLGIGLPMAARIVALLGGRLLLDSPATGGTEATLVLPAATGGDR
jgi:two-component system, OmpR family, phosphate regulon sensor histidine kinase PhoR